MTETQEIERGDAGFGWVINHLPTIMWQRKWYVFGLFGVLVLAAVIAAYSLPTLYQSSATLLIESQELPNNVVDAPPVGEIAQRIAKIRERVLSRGDLIALIEQYDLYASERRSKPMSEIIDRMRKATNVASLEGDVGAATPGTDNLIALKMTFDYPDPVKAQEVLQSYVSSFLRMDSDTVEDQAALTVRFLQDQAGKLQTQLQQVEGQLTDLKARNGTALATGAGPMVDTGTYSAQIFSLENQNRQLLIESKKPAGRNQAIANAEEALTAARAIYAETHPDVVAAKEKLKALRQALPETTDASDGGAIQEQIRANNDAISQLRTQREAAVARVTSAMAGQAKAPEIMEQASQLESSANALREQYKEVAGNLMKAQASARMAGEQRAERLSLVEPPSLPDSPNWPNRPLLMGAGAAAGLVLGLLLALFVELLRRPLRSPVQIESIGFPVLGIVPVYDLPGKKKGFWPFRRRKLELA
ncbi:MAG TPA: lipopolysaccharide biosynthesis protein [Sphingomicrobium sp.]|nr:lipopolysaccharide biosynthesis protein [Sphingomicrobium sp.]